MEIPILKEIVIVMGLAVGVTFLCHHLKLPTMVGFLLTGVLAGPHGLGLITSVHEVEVLAEIGVVLLLFTIGLEFSLSRLMQIKRQVLGGGSIQVVLTIAATYGLMRGFGRPPNEALFAGFLVSLSSTALVLRLLQQRADMDSPYGQTTLGILIFQDIFIIPMILFTPLLAGVKGEAFDALLLLSAKVLGIILLVVVCANWVVPHLLFQVAKTRSQELFLVSVIVLCFAVAWLTFQAGLSLALGAFLAGLCISESEYSHHTLSNILPFRDVFTSFFFISIGMLLDTGFLFKRPESVAILVSGTLVLKSLTAGAAAVALGFSLRTATLAGLALSQVGEFSFVLSKIGLTHNLLSGTQYQMFLAVSVLTMGATPFIIHLAPRLANVWGRLPVPQRLVSGWHPIISRAPKIKASNHLLIIGFGLSGKNIARAAKLASIPYAIIEMNPETVRTMRLQGEPIHYGDATHEAVLRHADADKARIVVVAINDPTATRRITEVARRLNPKAHLIVRTRYLHEMRPLYGLGADEVIPEEFETAVEIFTRVMRKFLITTDAIDRLVAEVRADGYEIFRSLSKEPETLAGLKIALPDMEITALRLEEGSSFCGKSLADAELRKRHGVTVLAIRRNTTVIANPGGETLLRPNDVLVVLGPPEKVSTVAKVLQSREGSCQSG